MSSNFQDFYYMDIPYGISREEVFEFLADHKITSDKQQQSVNLLLQHYHYFFFLTRLQEITNHIPLYLYQDNTTPIHFCPPPPPRHFTTYFQDLPDLWKTLIADLQLVYTLPPGWDNSQPVPEFKPSSIISKIMGTYYLSEDSKAYLLEHGYLMKHEIWIEDTNTQGITLALPLSLVAYARYFQDMLSNCITLQFPHTFHGHRIQQLTSCMTKLTHYFI